MNWMVPSPAQTRFLIVGLGALGGVVAHALCAAQFDVTVLVRRPDVERSVTTSGLRELRSGALVKPRIVSDGLNLTQPFDFVVMATQPTDVEAAVDGLSGVFSQGSQAICLQNGLCEERVASKIGAANVIGAVVTFGANSHGIGLCEHVPGGGLVIGRIDGTTDTTLMPACRLLERFRQGSYLPKLDWNSLV